MIFPTNAMRPSIFPLSHVIVFTIKVSTEYAIGQEEDEMKAIGIDIGTTTISGVVIDAGSKDVVFSRNIANDGFLSTQNVWEKIQDPEKIITQASGLLNELLTLFPDTASIGLTGQMHGILYVDTDGRAISPLYIWQDERGNLVGESGCCLAEEISHVTGKNVATGYGLVTHIYNSRNGLVPENAAKIMTIPDYLGSVLTSQPDLVMHTSMAASLGFFDVEKGTFDWNELEQFSVFPSLLPEVSRKIAVLGKYRNIPVTMALGDNQASYLGTVEGKKNTLLFNMGTGGQISLFSEKYAEIPEIDTRPYLDDSFLLVGSSLCGGRAYAIMEQFFRSYVKAACGHEESQYHTMEVLAEIGMKKRDHLRVDTRFAGTRSDPDRKGCITGISESNFTPESLVYGVIEGMVGELHSYYAAIQKTLGISADSVMASGNGIRKNKIMQEIVREMFDAELIVAQWEEEAARGAAISSLQTI
jgi:sedoheptulokinase